MDQLGKYERAKMRAAISTLEDRRLRILRSTNRTEPRFCALLSGDRAAELEVTRA